MRRLYVLDVHGSVRRERATPAEIRAFAEGASHAEQLAHVTLGDDGEIIVETLTGEDRRMLLDEILIDQGDRLIALLNASRVLVDMANDIAGVMVSGSAFIVWPAEAPWAEAIVREWASRHGMECYDEAPPAKADHWIRTMRVSASRYSSEIVRLQWPSVKLGDHAIAVEAMCAGMANAFKPAEIEEPF